MTSFSFTGGSNIAGPAYIRVVVGAAARDPVHDLVGSTEKADTVAPSLLGRKFPNVTSRIATRDSFANMLMYYNWIDRRK